MISWLTRLATIISALGVLLVAALAYTPVSARMYQWIDPGSGVTHLSGSPPSWYRGTGAGPRVFVFENGRMVDDTGIAVGAAERVALRDLAFGRAEPRVVQPDATGSPPKPDEVEPVSSDAAPSLVSEPSGSPGPEPAVEDPQATIERLRAIVSAWDAHRAEQAKALIDRASRE